MLDNPVLSKRLLVGVAALAMSFPLAMPANAAVSGPAQQQAASAVSGSSIQVVPARDLVNRALVDPQGHDAGQINGIVVNTETGRIDFAIVGGRGNFNLNGNVVAVPWPAFATPIPAQGPITVAVDPAKLAQAPELNPNALGNLGQLQTRRNIYGYYGYPYWGPWGYGAAWGARPGYGPGYGGARYGYGYGPGSGYGPGNANSPVNNGVNNGVNGGANAGVNAGAPGPERTGNVAAENAGRNAAQQQGNQGEPQLTSNGLFVSANGAISTLRSTNTASANEIRSAPVFISNYAGGYGGGASNMGGPTNGGQIGNIRDVMIDPRHGQVAFVLIERGGFLGLQPRWYAVPPEALTWAPYQGGFDLTVNDQLLNTAPPVQPANNTAPNAPVMVPVDQLAQLYGHFGMTPYWEQGMAGSSGRNTAGFAGANSGSSR